MDKIKRLDLGNLNPIYERELNKPAVPALRKARVGIAVYTRRRGGGMCLSPGRGAKDVGISNWRGASPLSETRGVREVSTKASKRTRATQKATGAVGGYKRSSWVCRRGRLRRRACSATRARRDTASPAIALIFD